MNVNQLIGAMFVACREHSVNIVKFKAVTNHPRVMDATIKHALLPGGVKDREAIHQAVGLLPRDKSQTNFIGRVIIQRNEDDEEEADLNRIFPPISKIQKKLAPIRQRQFRPID